MAEYKETHEIRSESGGGKSSSATPWLAFFVGALLIAVIAIFFMNAQGSFSGPAGRGELNIKSPVTIERAEPARSAEPARPAPAEPAPAK